MQVTLLSVVRPTLYGSEVWEGNKQALTHHVATVL